MPDCDPEWISHPPWPGERSCFTKAGAHLSNCLKYDMQTYLVDVLVRQDKMTMAHGLENRVPFLDRRVVDFARTLRADHLVGDSVPFSASAIRSTKIVVKGLAELMEDRLLPGIRQRGLVSEPAVRALWRRAWSAPALTEPFWIPVALELWAQQFVDGRRQDGGTGVPPYRSA